ncbi:putative dynein heavy chain [Cucumis melo var. makuwa]|uniref:Putative dynein heavy chain n=1 Tax=Cucumis melo var. makuwa TaxID=1194695 RepID=A0A5D3DGD7_CUCMM|nr:putative dynein heavy chain [Cucumis melo var. makuwa]
MMRVVGTVRSSVVKSSAVRSSVVRSSVVRSLVVWSSAVRSSAIRSSTVRSSTVTIGTKKIDEIDELYRPTKMEIRTDKIDDASCDGVGEQMRSFVVV